MYMCEYKSRHLLPTSANPQVASLGSLLLHVVAPVFFKHIVCYKTRAWKRWCFSSKLHVFSLTSGTTAVVTPRQIKHPCMLARTLMTLSCCWMQRLGRMLAATSPVPFVLVRQAGGWLDTKMMPPYFERSGRQQKVWNLPPQVPGFDFDHLSHWNWNSVPESHWGILTPLISFCIRWLCKVFSYLDVLEYLLTSERSGMAQWSLFRCPTILHNGEQWIKR